MKKIITIIIALYISSASAFAVEIGQQAPDIALPNTENKIRKLSEFKGQNVVLAFFPGAFTQVCTEEFCTFRDMTQILSEFEATVIGVSVDRPASNKAWAIANNLHFEILSDYNQEYVGQYDVQVTGLWGIPDIISANRAVFVIDKEGVIQYKWIADDPDKEPNYDEIKLALENLQ